MERSRGKKVISALTRNKYLILFLFVGVGFLILKCSTGTDLFSPHPTIERILVCANKSSSV